MSKVLMPFHLRISEGKYGAIAATMASCFSPRSSASRVAGTAVSKVENKINEAMGGVLFIDEAYALAGSNTVNGGFLSYGEEIIAALLKGMEDNRSQFCAILAGYKNEMVEMLSVNPGFKSRIQFTLEFPDYTRDELGMIANFFLEKQGYTIDDDTLERVLDITEYYRGLPNFANARTVRNVLNQVIMNQNLRTEDMGEDSVVIINDVEDYLIDEGINLEKKKTEKIGFS